MTSRALVVFKHDSALGNARAADLFDRVSVQRKGEGPPRSFSDYEIIVRSEGLPEGLHIQRPL